MNSAKGFLTKLAHANLIVSASSSGIAYVSCRLMGIAPTIPVLLIPFLSTFALYTLNRYTDREDRLNHPLSSRPRARRGNRAGSVS